MINVETAISEFPFRERQRDKESLSVKIQTTFLALRRWSFHWNWSCKLYLVPLLPIFIPLRFTGCTPNTRTRAYHNIPSEKVLLSSKTKEMCSEFFFFHKFKATYFIFTFESYRLLFQKLGSPFAICQLYMLCIFSDNERNLRAFSFWVVLRCKSSIDSFFLNKYSLLLNPVSCWHFCLSQKARNVKVCGFF